jgi:hypothetical protein
VIIRQAPDFFQKSFLDLQHIISSLNFNRKGGTPHRLAASDSFRASSFHAGPESGITISKNQKNARLSGGVILCHLDTGKKSNLQKSSLPDSSFIEMTYHVRGCMTFRSNEQGSALTMA